MKEPKWYIIHQKTLAEDISFDFSLIECVSQNQLR